MYSAIYSFLFTLVWGQVPHYFVEKFSHNILFYAKHKSLNFIYLTISFLSYKLYYFGILEALDAWLLTKVISNPHLID